MIVRQEQMKRFELTGFDRFVARLMQHLLRYHSTAKVFVPDAKQVLLRELAKPDLEKLVRYGIERAKSHQLTLEPTITGFVAMLFEIAPNLDSMPVMAAILRAPIDEQQKISMLCEVPGRAQWAEAVEKYDPNAWPKIERPGAG